MTNRIQLAMVSVLLVLGGLVGLSSWRPHLYSPPSKKANTPDFGFEGIRLTRFDHGHRLMTFEADAATIELGAGWVRFWEMQGQVFSGNQRILTFDAPLGWMRLSSGISRMSGARGTGELGGYNFDWKVPILIWSPNLNRIQGEGGVILSGNQFWAKAQRFWMDLTQQKMMFEGDPGEIFFQESMPK